MFHFAIFLTASFLRLDLLNISFCYFLQTSCLLLVSTPGSDSSISLKNNSFFFCAMSSKLLGGSVHNFAERAASLIRLLKNRCAPVHLASFPGFLSSICSAVYWAWSTSLVLSSSVDVCDCDKSRSSALY